MNEWYNLNEVMEQSHCMTIMMAHFKPSTGTISVFLQPFYRAPKYLTTYFYTRMTAD
jgi:hypothetical protein